MTSIRNDRSSVTVPSVTDACARIWGWNEWRAPRDSVQAGDPAAQGLHVLPDLKVFGPCFLVHLPHARKLEVGLQVAQRARDVVQVVGKQPAVAQFAQRRGRDRQEQ